VPHQASPLPALLSARVSLRQLASSASLPSFLQTVPYPGTLLCSAGSLGTVPRLLRSYSGALTSRRPRLRFVSFARLYRLVAATSGSPRFLGNPRVRALLSDPGGPRLFRPASGGLPYSSVLPRHGLRVFLDAGRLPCELDIGAQSHGPHAHCLRFAATVARMLPTATQDSFPAGEVALAVQDLNLRGSNVRFQACSVLTLHVIPLTPA
jgi:hypothetical protein